MSYLSACPFWPWLGANVQSLKDTLLLTLCLYWFEGAIWIAGLLFTWWEFGGHFCYLGAKLWGSVEISKKYTSLHIIGHWCGLSGCVVVAFLWEAISLEYIWATSFTSTASHPSRFYVNDYLCAVITIYAYSNLFFSDFQWYCDSGPIYDQTHHNVWRQPFILHHLEIQGSHSSQSVQGGPGENKVKIHSKLMGNSGIRSRKTQGPESRQEYTGQIHAHCPSH